MAAPGRALSGWRQGLPYLAALAVLAVLHQARLAETLNLALYDRALRSRPAPSGARTPIRLITIDETDLRQLGWPLADRVLVQAIERLQAAGWGRSALTCTAISGWTPAGPPCAGWPPRRGRWSASAA